MLSFRRERAQTPIVRIFTMAVLAGLLPWETAFASDTGGTQMPWNGPLQAVVDNLSGPTGHALVLLAIMVAGVIWAFTRHEEGGKKIGQIAVGGSLILGAASLMASMGFAGAVV